MQPDQTTNDSNVGVRPVRDHSEGGDNVKGGLLKRVVHVEVRCGRRAGTGVGRDQSAKIDGMVVDGKKVSKMCEDLSTRYRPAASAELEGFCHAMIW